MQSRRFLFDLSQEGYDIECEQEEHADLEGFDDIDDPSTSGFLSQDYGHPVFDDNDGGSSCGELIIPPTPDPDYDIGTGTEETTGASHSPRNNTSPSSVAPLCRRENVIQSSPRLLVSDHDLTAMAATPAAIPTPHARRARASAGSRHRHVLPVTPAKRRGDSEDPILASSPLLATHAGAGAGAGTERGCGGVDVFATPTRRSVRAAGHAPGGRMRGGAGGRAIGEVAKHRNSGSDSSSDTEAEGGHHMEREEDEVASPVARRLFTPVSAPSARKHHRFTPAGPAAAATSRGRGMGMDMGVGMTTSMDMTPLPAAVAVTPMPRLRKPRLPSTSLPSPSTVPSASKRRKAEAAAFVPDGLAADLQGWILEADARTAAMRYASRQAG
ncbi:hypothetical protein KEM52_006253 [Ascosphaera acerosa]|nr:hypothetical protein KEM52_006253 [Ascosphaera acerosa]